MTKRVVLVVDDDPLFQMLMQRIFSSFDLQLASAINVEEALRLAQELKPVLIIMDVYLPGGDGWQTALRIKNELEQVQIVVMSAGGVPVDTAKIAAFRCSGFFKKPFNVSAFMAFIKPLLE